MEEPITREQYECIELYLYGLRLFIEDDEFYRIDPKKIEKLRQEIYYMSITFEILTRYFHPTKSPRRSVVAWKAKRYATEKAIPTGDDDIYYFTSAQVAGKALDLEPGDICRVTNGRRFSLKGYAFMYLEDYQALEKTISKPTRKYWWKNQ